VIAFPFNLVYEPTLLATPYKAKVDGWSLDYRVDPFSLRLVFQAMHLFEGLGGAVPDGDGRAVHLVHDCHRW